MHKGLKQDGLLMYDTTIELQKRTNAFNAQININMLFDQCLKDGYLIGDIGLKQIFPNFVLVTCSKFAKIRDYPLDEIFF